MSKRPAVNEYSEPYKGYVALVPEEDVVPALEKQGRETVAVLRMLTDEKGSFRYAPEKWSVKQVIGHMVDTERVFTYRAMAIGRGETKSLPGFDEKTYAEAAGFERCPLRDLIDGYEAVRRATVLLFRSMPHEAWTKIGTANEKPVSVRALAYMTLGHERHHLKVLRERYQV